MSRFRAFLAGVVTLVLAFPAGGKSVTGLVFCPDGKTLISSCTDGFIRYWNVARGKEKLKVQAHRGGVFGIALSADGKWLASAGRDKKVRLWDVARIKELHTLEGHTQLVVAVASAPDGKTLASGGYDSIIRLWDTKMGKLRRQLKGHSHKVTGLTFSPDGKLLASNGIVPVEKPFGATQGVRLWEPVTGELIRKLPLRGHGVIFSSDCKTLASGGMYIDIRAIPNGHSIDGGSRIAVWDIVRNKQRLKIEEYGTAVALTADGRFLASGWGSWLHMGGTIRKGNRGTGIQLWDVAMGKAARCFKVPEENAAVVAIAPDARKLVAGATDGRVLFYDLAPEGWKAKTAKDLDGAAVEKRWDRLAAKDAATAYEAMWTLTAAGDRTVAYFRGRLRPAALPLKRVQKLIAHLDSKKYAVRQAASKELTKLGMDVEPALRHALTEQVSVEVRNRLQDLLNVLGHAELPPAHLRQSRALVVLERLGSKEARELLQRLAQGSPRAWLTLEAKAVLGRLAQRKEAKP